MDWLIRSLKNATRNMNNYNNSDFEKFLNYYESFWTNSNRRIRRSHAYAPYNFFSLDKSNLGNMPQYDEIEMIQINIPVDRLSELIESQKSYIYEQFKHENYLREQCPSLKRAWEQYQMILTLIDDRRI